MYVDVSNDDGNDVFDSLSDPVVPDQEAIEYGKQHIIIKHMILHMIPFYRASC